MVRGMCMVEEQRGNSAAAGILVVGAVMTDIVCCVPALPAPGEGVVVTQRSMALGGCAFNTANAIRQIGGDCRLFAPLGRGVFADFISRELGERGLSAVPVDTDSDCGTCTCLVTPDGERTMVTSPGIERRFSPTWFEGVDASAFSAGIAAGYEIEGEGGDAIIRFFERNPSLQMWYAPGPRITGVGREKTERINALSPVWHLNDQEARAFTGEADLDRAAAAIRAASHGDVVITRAGEGASVFTDAGRIDVPTRAIAPVDTIGAGDSHVGVAAACRASGLSWGESLARANAFAAAVCRVPGATMTDAQRDLLLDTAACPPLR